MLRLYGPLTSRSAEAREVEVDGATRIRDLESEFGIEIPTDAGFETLAGFLLFRMGEIPHPGESLQYEGRKYTVLEMERNRIARVRIEVIRAPDNVSAGVYAVQVGAFRSRAADAPLQLAGPQSVPQASAGNGHLDQPERAAVAVRQDRLWAVLGNDLLPPGGAFVHCLLPADPLPRTTTFRPNAAKRME